MADGLPTAAPAMAPLSLGVIANCLALASSTEVFVMLPLTTFKQDGGLQDKGALAWRLDRLKDAGVDGFMVDLWWGITEPSPKKYNFDSTREIVQMAQERGMKAQLVASFHRCGGNVGDDCDIKLPQFVLDQPDVWYKAVDQKEDTEYISLFADNVTISGRTPIQMYHDWFAALLEALGDLSSVIAEVQVGMGPAGELRYPAYQGDRWEFCGVGAFQCFDNYALKSFRAAAKAAGHPEYDSPPTDAGNYNSKPPNFGFFKNAGGVYAQFFMDWYSSALKAHGKAVLGAAKSAFGDKIHISGKIAGIHWWYKHPSHAAELTAGYYNINGRNAYEEIAREVFKPVGATLDFTCLEMKDMEQPQDCAPGPQELVGQVIAATRNTGVSMGGENALPRYDSTAYWQIQSVKSAIGAFTYLRLTDQLLEDKKFNTFRGFVHDMHQNSALIQI